MGLSVPEYFAANPMSFGEDLAWAVQILEAGLALVHEPEAVVVHSHPSALQRDFRRHRADAQLLRALFGLRPSILEEAQATAGSIWRDWQVLGQGSGWPGGGGGQGDPSFHAQFAAARTASLAATYVWL